MGFRVSLYAVFDREPAQIQRDLNLVPNGEMEEFPDSAVAGFVTASGAYILYFNDSQMFGEDAVRPLRSNSQFLTCNVNETCMYSSVAAFAEGRELWCVIHDSDRGILDLETRGDVPRAYSEIRQQQLSLQQSDGEGVDHIFDVPINLFVRLGGVRYDQDVVSEDPRPWHTLVSTTVSKRRWWPFAK